MRGFKIGIGKVVVLMAGACLVGAGLMVLADTRKNGGAK